MSLLDEIAFHRLLPRYERRYGAAPPLEGATLEEALAVLRAGLAERPGTDQRDRWSARPH